MSADNRIEHEEEKTERSQKFAQKKITFFIQPWTEKIKGIREREETIFFSTTERL